MKGMAKRIPAFGWTQKLRHSISNPSPLTAAVLEERERQLTIDVPDGLEESASCR
jgi:hypothetical protein